LFFQVHDDRASFVIINRRTPKVPFTLSQDGIVTTITTSALELRYTDDQKKMFLPSNLQIKLLDESVVWTPGTVDTKNLNGTLDMGPAFAGCMDW
jgi:hypothetical protein